MRNSLVAVACGLCLLAVAPDLTGAGAPARTLPARGLAQQAAIAASGLDQTLTFAELDPVLADRWAFAPEGREAIAHLVKVRLIESEAARKGMIVSDAELSLRWNEVDRAAREQGLAGGLLEELASSGIGVEEFRELLRTAMYHERLTREALGLAEDKPVTAEMQEVWIEELLQAGGYEAPPPPWKDGVAARCGDVEVGAQEYYELLRLQLPPDNVRELCFQMLLRKGLNAYAARKLPDLSDAARAAAIEREIERRRLRVANDPRYPGVSLEDVLKAQGMSIASLDRDPAVVVASLAMLLVDRQWGEEGLRGVYEAERQDFENLYGAAIETRFLFLNGVQVANELQPRDLTAAAALARSIAAKATSEADFIELVGEFSEDAATQANDGALGWVTRAGDGIPAAMRDAIFAPVEIGDGIAPGGEISGPHLLDSPSGVYLLWHKQHRPSPPWESMRVHVHRELRKRLFDEVMPRRDVVTFLDPQ